MSKYALLKQLLDELDEFQQQVEPDEQTTPNFAYWLLRRQEPLNPGDRSEAFDPARPVRYDHSPETEISALVAGLYKYAKAYAKKAMEDSPVKTLDEFGFLATLLRCDSATKSELIHSNQIEFTSGNDIIRRLNALGLIEELPDPHDRRSKRVRLTPTGRQHLFALFGQMNQAAHLVAGPLSPDEKLKLIGLLKKLKYFHQEIRQKDRGADLDSILQKYL